MGEHIGRTPFLEEKEKMESFSLLFTVCSFRLKRTSLICACEVRPPIRVKYSSVVQQVERVTVNHDDTGSSPVRGERKNFVTATGFSLGNINKNYLWLKTKKKTAYGYKWKWVVD